MGRLQNTAGKAAVKEWILATALSMLLAAVPAFGQAGPPGGPPMRPPSSPPIMFPGPRNGPGDPELAHILHQQALARNVERQKDLVKDTNKLLKLAQQLKVAVDKSNKDTLSIDVIKKANQIQKLAKSISSKMKGNN